MLGFSRDEIDVWIDGTYSSCVSGEKCMKMVVETCKRRKPLRRLTDNISANLMEVRLSRCIELNWLRSGFSWELL